MVFIFLFHFIADFVCQSREMGRNKSTNFMWLFKHLLTYTTVLGVLSYPLFSYWLPFVVWLIINFYIHLITDFFTSKLSGYFYLKNKEYMFWNIIGIDQTIHFITLYLTSSWLLK